MTRRVAIIGGGITGLAAAHRLRELDPTVDVTVYEAALRLGGVLFSERTDGFLIEHSADNFITDQPWGLDLCRRIGLAEQLQSTNVVGRRAFVVRRGKLLPVPQGFLLMAPQALGPMLTTRILSPWGKLRLALEPFVAAKKTDDDESLGSFVRRRLGREAFDRLVQPLISGIYTADPERLSVQAALPRFVQMERAHGSLIRALRRQAASNPQGNASAADSGARYSQFVAPREGMSALVQALADRLPANAVRLGARVEQLQPLEQGRWRATVRQGANRQDNDPPQSADYDAVCVALPAPRAAEVLLSADAELAALLGRIPYAGCVVAVVAARRADMSRLPDGFGVVVPEIERRRALSISFSSHKYAGRAPDDQVLIRVFLGGACHPEADEWTDDEVVQNVQQELQELVGLRTPVRVLRILRWRGAMPQYHIGHVQLVERIRTHLQRWPTLALAGNAYEGVGVPVCIHSGETATERLHGAMDA